MKQQPSSRRKRSSTKSDNRASQPSLHHARRRTQVVIDTVVSDSWTPQLDARPGISANWLWFARPLYWMLGQFAGAAASIRRFALFGSYGTSWTAMVDAGTEPSFRMMCT